jgi:PmbA/TldA metallopeptidase C-terminal domain
VPESGLCYHGDVMERDERSGLSELAAAVAHARVAGLVDVYLERRADALWRLAAGRVVARETLLREGAAVRRAGAFASSDGLDRPALAGLLGITSRALPAFAAPRFPDTPTLEDAAPAFPPSWSTVRWRWSWAAVLAGRSAVAVSRPELAEVTFCDGRRALACWPALTLSDPDSGLPAASAAARPGPTRVLLAPAAAAALVHELIGHPLEGDLLLRGGSPWAGRSGQRILHAALSVTDDPTRADLPGAFSADDEGEAAASRLLLAGGVLVGALADRRTAEAIGARPGNARRAGVHAPPRPRMSNLIVEAAAPLPQPPRGDAAVEVVSVSGGTLEPATGAILLHVRTAFALRGGSRRQRLAPFTLVGTVAKLARGILAAAEPAAAAPEPGWCGKDGEAVPTGAVAPWLLLEGMEVR